MAWNQQRVIRTGVQLLQAACFVHLFNENVCEIKACLGLSMYPTFSRTGTFLLVSRIHRRIDPSPAPSFSTSHAHQDTRSDLKPTYKPSHSVFGPINRGDLVIAISPFDPSIQVCKRVIGLPGDTVCANPGPPPSSSHQLPSSSSSSRSGGGAPSQFDEIDEFLGLEDGKKVYVKIPKGHVWLQGDNLSNSTDSRVYGPVPLAMIKGKVLARVWPNPCFMRSTFQPIEW